MLPQKTIKQIIPILRKDLGRAKRIRVAGFPRVYYASFLLRDTHWFNTWSNSGSVYRVRSDHTRNVYCDLRVGTATYDQVTHGGLHDNDDERESKNHVNVPIDDTNYDGLRLGLWRLVDAKYRESVADYKDKEVTRLTRSADISDLPAFKKLPAGTFFQHETPQDVKEEKWERFCKVASKWMSTLPQISTAWVEFDANQVTKIFVNTERRTVVQHERVFALMASLKLLKKDGTTVEQEWVINSRSIEELPTLTQFKKEVLRRHETLLRLAKAKKIHAYTGPALLMPGPAGLLFHEAVGHRLEGSRLLSSHEGQTFKGHVGERILNIDVTIQDNPTLKEYKGIQCIGAYDFDDEGTPAGNALLIEDGVLKGFLNTRMPLQKRKYELNGHARNRKDERPISRMGVTVVSGKHTLSPPDMKAMLIREIKRQKKPYGLIVYEANSGETETDSYDFQAFLGHISFATLLYPDGRESVVRGVNFVGTPLQALSSIIAIGDDVEAVNDYCGAESGLVPVTTISPSVLLSSLELQSKEEEEQVSYVLPKPKMKH